MFYRSMKFLAEALGLIADSKMWNEKSLELEYNINRCLWDSENNRYVDKNRFNGEFSTVLSPASFMPLYLRIASAEQANSMRIIAEENFKCKYAKIF